MFVFIWIAFEGSLQLEHSFGEHFDRIVCDAANLPDLFIILWAKPLVIQHFRRWISLGFVYIVNKQIRGKEDTYTAWVATNEDYIVK